MHTNNLVSRAVSVIGVLTLALLVASCKHSVDRRYTVGGNVAGLSSSGLMLQNNSTGNLKISGNGGFIFPGTLEKGERYSVSVHDQPLGQNCTVANGSGTINGNVTDVAVNCGGGAATVTIGGTVSGLVGTGLVLQDNGADNLPVAADGAFTFATPVASGGAYGVTILTQPSGQGCDVANGSGTAGSVNVTGVVVTCRVPPAAPTLSLAFGVKQLKFSWPAVTGADFYRLFEDPDGASGFSQVGTDISGLSFDDTIPVHLRLNAEYVLEACNTAGCSSDSAPVVLGANLTQAIGYFKASNTGLSDQFGFAVALSADGNTLAVGARNEDSSTTGINTTPDELATDAGAVYVYARSAAGWSQQAYVKASNTGAGDQFGNSVALSADGNTLAVGAVFEGSSTTGINSVPDDNAAAAGAVYVYTRSGATWSQQAYVKASNTGASDLFGNSVALSGSGDTLVVGAPFEGSSTIGINSTPNDLASRAGAAYVFVRGAGSWSQQAYIKASNTGANDQFGTAVAVSDDGNTAAVGAPREDSNTTGIDSTPSDPAANFDSGAVYVFVRSGAAWVQQAYVKASNTGSGDQFGISVALSGDGDTLAAGAVREDSSTTGINSVPDDSALDAGAAYVFVRVNDLWSQQAYVKPLETRIGDQFGTSVALSFDGNALAVGAPFQDLNGTGIGSTATALLTDSGAAYFYVRSAGTWSQKTYVKPSNTGAGDRFGTSVALSGDGNTFAVGAQLEDGSATGIDGASDDLSTDSGAVYLY